MDAHTSIYTGDKYTESWKLQSSAHIWQGKDHMSPLKIFWLKIAMYPY